MGLLCNVGGSHPGGVGPIHSLSDIFSPKGVEERFCFGDIEVVFFGDLKQFFVFSPFDDSANIHVPIFAPDHLPYISRGKFDWENIIRLIERFRAISSNQQSGIIESEIPIVINRLYLDVSLNCNLRCRYCYVDQKRKGLQKMMSADMACAAIDWIVRQRRQNRSLEVRFFGGEPLLNLKVIREVVSHCNDLQDKFDISFRYFLSTNGTLIDKACAIFLSEADFKVKVSFDGPESEHNANRIYPDGKGSYQATLNGIEKLLAYGIRPTLSVTTYGISSYGVRLATSEIAGLGNLEIQWQTVSSISPACFTKDSKSDSMELYETLASQCFEELLLGDSPLLSFFAPGIRKLCDASADLRGCGSGLDSIMVSPDGTFYLCQRFLGHADFSFGNLASGCCTDRLRLLFLEALEKYKCKCKDCWIKFLCSKGCYYTNYLRTGDIGKVEHQTCENMKAYFKAIIWLCYKMACHLPQDFNIMLNNPTFLV